MKARKDRARKEALREVRLAQAETYEKKKAQRKIRKEKAERYERIKALRLALEAEEAKLALETEEATNTW